MRTSSIPPLIYRGGEILMKTLSDTDLKSFQTAILKDYGVNLEGKELYSAAYNLLQFFETLIKYDIEAKKEKGSKVVLEEFLTNPKNGDKME